MKTNSFWRNYFERTSIPANWIPLAHPRPPSSHPKSKKHWRQPLGRYSPKMENLNKHLKIGFGRGRAFFLSSARKSPSSADWPLSLLCRDIGFWIGAIGTGCPLLLPSTSAHPSIAPGIGLNSEMWKFELKQYYLLFSLLIIVVFDFLIFLKQIFLWNFFI